ncbi:MAG: signal peptidase I [Eubacteriales bacterium]|nr:signal peptidase I [Eubacteriales bacterium]
MAYGLENTRIATREEIERLLAETVQYEQAGPLARRRLKRRSAARTPAQKLLHIASSALYYVLVAVLCAVLFIGIRAKMKNEVPQVLGFYLFTVKTGSMVPTLPIGSYIVVQESSNPAAIEKGTIVTFRFLDGTIVTHRIIDVRSTEEGVRYQTKGDNPDNDPDPELLSPDRVIGTMQFVIRLPQIW